MLKRKQPLSFVLILTLAGLVGATSCGQSEEGRKNAVKAYDFTLSDLDSKEHRLSDFKGKVVIVDFWDTWCPPCRKEIPEFVELHKEYADQGFVMIGVAGGQRGIRAVRSFIEQYEVPYLNLLATMEAFEGFGGIVSIPTTFVIDQEGYIYKKYVGYTPKRVFENDIKTLLSKGKGKDKEKA